MDGIKFITILDFFTNSFYQNYFWNFYIFLLFFTIPDVILHNLM